MKKITAVLTDHAIDRAKEIGLTPQDAMRLFRESKQRKIGLKYHFYKLLKYGNAYRKIEYYVHRGRNILFTVRRVKKELVIITVTQK